MQEINIVEIEIQDKKSKVKEFTRKYKLISTAIVFIAIFIIVINVCNAFVIPSEAEVADMCEKHLRISRDISNVARYDNASSKTLDNGDILITVSQRFYKIVARYDSNMKLISPLEEVYTIPFYPYTVYSMASLITTFLSWVIITILKKKEYFKKLY